MSSRERWTIYPLLFLALGVALRDKLTSTVDSRFITCEELDVVDRHGQLQMRLTSHDGDSGKLLLYGADGRLAVAAEAEQSRGQNVSAGAVRVLEGGMPRVVLSSSAGGGAVTAIDRERNLLITLGHEREHSGVMAENRRNRATFSARFEPRVTVKSGSGKSGAGKAASASAAPNLGEQLPAGAPSETAPLAPTPGWHSGRKIP